MVILARGSGTFGPPKEVPLRTDFLVHWTGKGIPMRGTDNNGFPVLDAAQKQAYIDRLRTILNQGIWLTRPNEIMFGNGGSNIRYTYQWSALLKTGCPEPCRMKYGLLGVAVDRRFVLDRNGGPVHYVRNNSRERIVAETADVGSWIKKTVTQPQDQYVADAFYYMVSFLKAMSNAADDFALLDENEWRVAFTEEANVAGHVVSSIDSPEGYTLTLSPKDVRLVVFPTASVLTKAATDPFIANWFQQGAQHPVFLTIRDCSFF